MTFLCAPKFHSDAVTSVAALGLKFKGHYYDSGCGGVGGGRLFRNTVKSKHMCIMMYYETWIYRFFQWPPVALQGKNPMWPKKAFFP